MIDTASVGPIALNLIAALDRTGDTTGNPLTGNHNVRALCKDALNTKIGEIGAASAALDVANHQTPARGAVRPCDGLNYLHGLGQGQLGAVELARQQHSVEASLLKGVDNPSSVMWWSRSASSASALTSAVSSWARVMKYPKLGGFSAD